MYDHEAADERERERNARRFEFFEERIRNLENEQTRLASMLDKEQAILRETLRQHKEVLEKHAVALMGDGDQREGLINWKNAMERRYSLLSKQILAAITAVGGLLLELLREKLTELLK